MSNVNIRRAIENIRAYTTVYTPVVEMIVNAIQAIDETGRADGKVTIRAYRSGQPDLEDGLPPVTGFEIEDNGIGFTDEHRNSFDTLYSDFKIKEGGKGFGRFTCLKYFEDLHVRSVYRNNNTLMDRSFSMGKENDIVVDEIVALSNCDATGTVVTLSNLKQGRLFEKKLSTLARNLVERLLPYFITHGYVCPEIILLENDGNESIRLNDYVGKPSSMIQELGKDGYGFKLQTSIADEHFQVRVFKIFSPRHQRSRVSLVAHKREVSGSPIHKYVPEFDDEFYDKESNGDLNRERNYIIKAYVFGPYLDRNVSLERGRFEFGVEADLLTEIGQAQIERKAAMIAKESLGAEITLRQEKKKERVRSYVDAEAPWHKEIINQIDLSAIAYNATPEEIETYLQKEKIARETEIKRDVARLLEEDSLEDVRENVLDIVDKISGTSKNDLIHYIALRKKVLDILGKSLEVNESGKYSSEGLVHNIIFPRKGHTDKTPFEDHNLWILDERLNFTSYVASDLPLNGGNTERPDLIVYNKRVLFRGDNEPSNPIVIFEFKKPQRDNFVNPSSEEDPIQQIVRYVNDIRDGKYKTPEGRKILVSDSTPFYGYVVCDITNKIESWLHREKDFKPMPDRLGWFHWITNNNLYIEVLSWDKVLKDAEMRNRVFFHKLGI